MQHIPPLCINLPLVRVLVLQYQLHHGLVPEDDSQGEGKQPVVAELEVDLAPKEAAQVTEELDVVLDY